MRRQSLKKQKERRVSAKLDNAIKDNICDRCEQCGNACDLDPHHIASGSYRRELAHFRSKQWLCRECHDDWQSTDVMGQFVQSCLMTARAINGEFGSQRLDLEKISGVLLQLLLKP